MSPERAARLVLEDLAAAVDNDLAMLSGIAQGINEARTGLSGAPDRYRLSFFAVELARYYTAFEHLAEMVERTLAVPPPRSERWHQDLLDAAGRDRPGVRPALVGLETRLLLQELLGFRHFVRNAYAVELRWKEHLERHTRNLAALHQSLARELAGLAKYLRDAALTLARAGE